MTAAAWLACVVLAALAVFQVALVAGAPLGRLAWGGAHRVLPGRLRIGSAVSVLLYALFGVVILQAAGVLSGLLPAGVVDVAIWVLAGYFLLGVGLNLASRSPAERAVMAPVSAVLCGCCVIVALA